jgi:hypothetical protein
VQHSVRQSKSQTVWRSHRVLQDHDRQEELEALIILIAALSPASRFAIERGNIDLLIFALMYLGCVTGRKGLKSSLFALAAMKLSACRSDGQPGSKTIAGKTLASALDRVSCRNS